MKSLVPGPGWRKGDGCWLCCEAGCDRRCEKWIEFDDELKLVDEMPRAADSQNAGHTS